MLATEGKYLPPTTPHRPLTHLALKLRITSTDTTNEIIEEEIRDRERIRVFVESNDEFLEFTSHKERIRVTQQRSDTIDSTHLWRIERFKYQQRVATMEDLRSRFVNLRQNIAQLKDQRDDLNKERVASLREIEDAEVDGTMI